MDVKQYIRTQFAACRRVVDAVTADLTDEMTGWMPPGNANPIGATLVHLINAEDSFVQKSFQGKPLIWDSGAWGERMGLGMLPGRGGGWDEARGKQLCVESLLAYQQAVRAETDAYLANLTPAELCREVDFAGRQRPVGDVLALLVAHTAHHAGDISAIKGVQGAKGLPF